MIYFDFKVAFLLFIYLKSSISVNISLTNLDLLQDLWQYPQKIKCLKKS
jgi:hypothetical protein